VKTKPLIIYHRGRHGKIGTREIKENTIYLNNIRELLDKNQSHDVKLEEKNNEINVSYFLKLKEKKP
jgi:hypothetical protein